MKNWQWRVNKKQRRLLKAMTLKSSSEMKRLQWSLAMKKLEQPFLLGWLMIAISSCPVLFCFCCQSQLILKLKLPFRKLLTFKGGIFSHADGTLLFNWPLRDLVLECTHGWLIASKLLSIGHKVVDKSLGSQVLPSGGSKKWLFYSRL